MGHTRHLECVFLALVRVIGLVLDGFSSYQDRCELDLSEVTACAVVGANGAGKSSLVDGLLWCLFGETNDRTAESVICETSDVARAEVTFTTDDNTQWTVTRERRRSGSQSARAVSSTNPDHVIDGAKEVAQHVGGLLNCGAKTLCATAFARQGAAGLFADGSASQQPFGLLVDGSLGRDCRIRRRTLRC